MIFRHYRELVKPKDADRYWKVAPAAAGKKLVQFTSATHNNMIGNAFWTNVALHAKGIVVAVLAVMSWGWASVLRSCWRRGGRIRRCRSGSRVGVAVGVGVGLDCE